MLGRSNEFFYQGTSAEDQMKVFVVRDENQEIYEHNMFKEAARRVVFRNCMGVCNLTDKTLPHFNKNFYYHMEADQQCLEECYNDRMLSHFGDQAKKDNMLIDFKRMKYEFQGYQKWSPEYLIVQKYSQQNSKDDIQQITSSLLEKSKRERYGKFDFQ